MIEDFELKAKQLQPLGIIINELITNIMKYAFTGKDKGLITISATMRGNLASFSVADNGIGIPESVDFERPNGFGLQLVLMLTRELKGKIRIERKNGSKFILQFNL